MFKCKSCSNNDFVFLKKFYACKKCNRLYSFNEIKESIDYLVDEFKVSILKNEFKNREFNFVKIPDNVTYIEESAFENCNNLLGVFFSNESYLISIKDNAFYNCNNLSYIDIPLGVKNIGFNVFGNTKFVNNITLYKGAKYIGNDDNKYLMLYESNYELDEIEIHKDTKYILNSAFVDDLIIKTLIINEKLVDIGEYAFDGCKNLYEIIKQNDKQKIDIKDNSFLDCFSLKYTI